jgi:hypothetical protein
MSPDDIRLRQQRLLVRSTDLRHTLHHQLQSLQRPAALADRVKAGLLWLYQHPQWPAGALALWLILKPRRFITWTSRVWWLWKTAQKLRHLRDSWVSALTQPPTR